MTKTFLRLKECEAFSAGVQQQNMRDWMVIFQQIIDNPRANEVEVETARSAFLRCEQRLSGLIEDEGEVYPSWFQGSNIDEQS